MFSAGTLKPVSFMPSGSQTRSRTASPKDMPVARAMRTPVTLAAVWYIQRSPGWQTSGSLPSRLIHSSGAGAGSSNTEAFSASAIGIVPGSAGTTPVPRVYVSRSRSVIARCAGTVRSSGPFGSASTVMSASSGRNSSTGSSRRSVQSSTSVIAQAATIGLVIDPVRQIVSAAIGTLEPSPSNARLPIASMWTSPRRATTATAPGT